MITRSQKKSKIPLSSQPREVIAMQPEQTHLAQNKRSGEELAEIVGRIYRCNEASLVELKQEIPFSELINDLVDGMDAFLKRSTKDLNYFCFSFIINLGIATFYSEKFSLNSPILKSFIKNLQKSQLDTFETKKLLVALLEFNDEAVENAVLRSGDLRLIKILFETEEMK